MPSPAPIAADSTSPAPAKSEAPSVASGTIPWDCEVKHLDAGPINDMFKKLSPTLGDGRIVDAPTFGQPLPV